MGKRSEVFVAFDVAKKKHAVAIAEGGQTGGVRFLGDVENSPLPIVDGTDDKAALIAWLTRQLARAASGSSPPFNP
jgi:hypothetical protein